MFDTFEEPFDNNIQNLIFDNGFACCENFPEIYHSLFPEDEYWQNYKYHEIKTQTSLVKDITNCLSFLVQKNHSYGQLICLNTTNYEPLNLHDFAIFADISIDRATTLFGFGHIKIDIINFIFLVGEKGNAIPIEDVIKKYEQDSPREERINFEVLSEKNNNIPDTTLFNEYSQYFDLYNKIVYGDSRNPVAFRILAENCIANGIYEDIFESQDFEDELSSFYTPTSTRAILERQEMKLAKLREESRMLKRQNKRLDRMSEQLKQRNRKLGYLTLKIDESIKTQIPSSEGDQDIRSLEAKNRQLKVQLEEPEEEITTEFKLDY